MHENKMLKVNLQMFNDGGTASGGEGATAQATEGALPKADKSGSSRRNSGEPKVVYGKQTDVSETTTTIPAAEGVSEGNGIVTTSDSKEAKMAKFKEMVEGEFKDEYTSMFQDSFNRRFKDVKGLENSLSAQKPIIDMLMERHGITDGDMAKLQTAVEEDTQYWENRAEEEGLTVEQSKMMDKLKRENEELNKMQERQRNEMRAKAQLAQWARDGEAVKKAYPSFDFGVEAKNPHFLGLLGKGLSVMDAYKLVHNDEIIEAEKRAAAQATGAQMEARIKSKASRPSENGMSSQSAAIVKKDTVSSLNKKDRAAIAKEVLRGGRITF
jgi:hypothetical protein